MMKESTVDHGDTDVQGSQERTVSRAMLRSRHPTSSRAGRYRHRVSGPLT